MGIAFYPMISYPTSISFMESMEKIYTYTSDEVIYSLGKRIIFYHLILAWSSRSDQPFRLSIGSFSEKYLNQVEIVSFDENQNQLVKSAQFEHPYPPYIFYVDSYTSTKLMFIPDTDCQHEDLLASTSESLKIWKIEGDTVSEHSNLKNVFSHFGLTVEKFSNESSFNLI